MIKRRVLVSCILLLSVLPVYAQHYPVVDLAEALNAWNQSVKEKWDQWELGRAITRWDLYTHAQGMAEATISSVAVRTLEHIHKALAQNCNNELSLQEVADVFAELPQGIQYRRLLERRDIVDDIQTNRFERSCVEVVKCAQKYEWPVSSVNLYSNDVREWCKDIVANLWTLISVRLDRLERLDDLNYGDDLLVNGEVKDGPFDLMDDIKKIADIMFSHADSPAKTNFYTMKEPWTYGAPSGNPSPLDPKTYLSGLEDKAAKDPWRYMPPGQWDIPASTKDLRPEVLTESMKDGDRARLPKQWNPETTTPVDTPAAWPIQWPGQASITLPSAAAQAIDNPICFVPPAPDPEPDILDLAEKEQKATFEYNDQLDIENRILESVAKKVFRDEEIGADDRWPGDQTVEEQAQQIANELEVNGGDDAVKELYDQFKQCVKQETTMDPDTYLKAVRKGLTQPTALSACVRKQMCKEISVAEESLSQMWASFGITICKIPPKKFGVNSNQAVYAIEDILDEHLNVCTNTRQSGQLLKSIQPKDAWTLVTSKTIFKDILSFRIFMRGGVTRYDTDYPAEKTFHKEYNKYLMQSILQVSPKLTTTTERNKYIVIANPLDTQAWNLVASTLEDTQTAQKQVEFFDRAQQERMPQRIEQKTQLTSTARILEQFGQWTNQQLEYWRLVNDHTYMMRETVEAKVNTRQK